MSILHPSIRRHLLQLIACIALWLSSAAVFAQTYTYEVYVDADGRDDTGCTTPLGAPAEVRLQVQVDALALQVQSVRRAVCDGAAFTGDAMLAAGHPVAVGGGVDGSDAIELSDSLDALRQDDARQLGFRVLASGAGGTDTLGEAAPAILPLGLDPSAIPQPVSIPLLGLPALLLAVAMLAMVGLRRMRRTLRTGLVVLLVVGSGIAIAAEFLVDGLVHDWTGTTPRAVDPAGDAVNSGIDLRALSVEHEQGTVFLRLDVTRIVPDAAWLLPVAATLREDTTAEVVLAGDDATRALTFEITTPPAHGSLATLPGADPNQLRLRYTPGADFNGSDGFEFTATDAFGTTSEGVGTFTVTPVNDAPSFVAQDPAAVIEGAGPQSLVVASSLRPGPVTAVDEAGQVLRFEIDTVAPAGFFIDVPSIDADGVLQFESAPGVNGVATLTMRIVDDGGTEDGGIDRSEPQTVRITVTAVDDVPVITPGATPLQFTEGDAPSIVDAALLVSDADSDALLSAQVRLIDPDPAGTDRLELPQPPSGITASFDAAASVLSLSGNASVATYQQALRAVVFHTASQAPAMHPRTVEWIASDAAGSSVPALGRIEVAAVNNPPVVTVAATVADFIENDPPRVLDPLVSLADPDSATLTSASVRIASDHAAGEEVLQGAAFPGIGVLWEGAAGTLTFSGEASVSDYVDMLRNVVYINTSNAPPTTPRTIEWQVSDGLDDSAVVTTVFDVIAVNDAPTLQLTRAAYGFVEGDPPLVLDPDLVVMDIDSPTLVEASVRFDGAHEVGVDVLGFTPGAGITGAFDEQAGVLALSGTADLVDYQAVLRTVTFSNTSHAPATASIDIVWSLGDGEATADAGRATLSLQAVNDGPVITAGGQLVYTRGDSPSQLDASVTVSDPDHGDLQTAEIQITGGFVQGQDLLSVAPGALAGSMLATFDPQTGMLRIEGAGTLAQYQGALREVRYVNLSKTPDTSLRTVGWRVHDGIDWSSQATSTITVLPGLPGELYDICTTDQECGSSAPNCEAPLPPGSAPARCCVGTIAYYNPGGVVNSCSGGSCSPQTFSCQSDAGRFCCSGSATASCSGNSCACRCD